MYIRFFEYFFITLKIETRGVQAEMEIVWTKIHSMYYVCKCIKDSFILLYLNVRYMYVLVVFRYERFLTDFSHMGAVS